MPTMRREDLVSDLLTIVRHRSRLADFEREDTCVDGPVDTHGESVERYVTP